MNELSTDILIVGGGPAGMSAAMAAAESDAKVTLIDDNPRLGGQIWRTELGKRGSSESGSLINAISTGKIGLINNAQVFAAPEQCVLAAETSAGRLDISYTKLIVATGARERFLPFPGWTLPGVFGAGGLQAMVKGGLSVDGKRIVVAGTGPLLLAVADYIRSKGGRIVAIAEQTSAAKLRRFAFELRRSPSKLIQGATVRARLLGVPYLTDCWVTHCRSPRASEGKATGLGVEPSPTRGSLQTTLIRKQKAWTVECDYLACGFHLVPNIELPSLMGCTIEDGYVAVDEFHRTSCENVYCAGEPTGIGGVDASLVEGRIAGHAAAGNEKKARDLFSEREKTRRFQRWLDRACALREELRNLADDDTCVCRCEDVTYGRLKIFPTAREAKLQVRHGMGSCQGRVCGPASQFLFGWQADRVRPPIFPVKMENL